MKKATLIVHLGQIAFVILGLAGLALAAVPTVDPGFQGTVDQAVGSYAKGTLIHDSTLALQGEGFVKLFVPRSRWYATSDLVGVIGYIASEMTTRFPNHERLQIGDVSQHGGGPISGHASHMIGLDADFAYFNVSQREQDPQDVSGFKTSYVQNGKITKDFDIARNFTAMRVLVGTGRVNRIFVNEVVKKAICDYSKTLGPDPTPVDPKLASIPVTLRRLRPWEGHDDHMHLRLTCPKASPRCVPQEEPPVGDGCADVLNQNVDWDQLSIIELHSKE